MLKSFGFSHSNRFYLYFSLCYSSKSSELLFFSSNCFNVKSKSTSKGVILVFSLDHHLAERRPPPPPPPPQNHHQGYTAEGLDEEKGACLCLVKINWGVKEVNKERKQVDLVYLLSGKLFTSWLVTCFSFLNIHTFLWSVANCMELCVCNNTTSLLQ